MKLPVIGQIVKGVIEFGRFLIGDKKIGGKLEDPLGELKTEATRQRLEEARNAHRNHGGGGRGK